MEKLLKEKGGEVYDSPLGREWAWECSQKGTGPEAQSSRVSRLNSRHPMGDSRAAWAAGH